MDYKCLYTYLEYIVVILIIFIISLNSQFDTQDPVNFTENQVSLTSLTESSSNLLWSNSWFATKIQGSTMPPTDFGQKHKQIE